jgi:hypothetical protein
MNRNVLFSLLDKAEKITGVAEHDKPFKKILPAALSSSNFIKAPIWGALP